MFLGVHHIAIICSNYEVSKQFYTQVLGLEIIREEFREEKKSFKLDLAVQGQYIIELFSFPDPPKRPSRPESCGLRHLAFKVKDIAFVCDQLHNKGVTTEPIKIDPYTGKKYTFFQDPDGLPIELYSE